MMALLPSPPLVLAYGEGDFQPYWLLALLLITFINWIATQLKRRQAKKRGQNFAFDPEVFAPYRDAGDRGSDSLRKREDRGESEEQTPVQSNARDEVRDFFTALTGQTPVPPQPTQPTAAPARRPIEPPPTPPRPPSQVSSSAYQIAGAEGSAYLERLKTANVEAKARKAALTVSDQEAAALYQRQFGSTSRARSNRNRSRNNAITRLLREPGSLRAAVVLREVLGPPKGLQTDGDAPTL